MAGRALVTGVTGQDGWYLTELLHEQGYAVFGLVQEAQEARSLPDVSPIVGDLSDGDSLRRAIWEVQPDEIYNLAAVSSVAASWIDPAAAIDVNGAGVARLLRAVEEFSIETKALPRVVQASSAEMFGDAGEIQREDTPLRPNSPYGASKALAHNLVRLYRAVGVRAAAAILYNHESPRRPTTFVSRKITSAVARISLGSNELLALGNLDARRDWGHAKDYVRAMTLMARHEPLSDFVICSGTTHTVRDFVRVAFQHVGISEWERHVRIDPASGRPSDTREQRGDPSRARNELHWSAETSFEGLVESMVNADIALHSRGE